MTTPIAQLSYTVGSNDTFQTLADRVNLIANAISNAVVTVDVSSNGSMSVGNAYIVGTFSALTLATPTLQGGNVATSANLAITSNVVVGNSTANVFVGYGFINVGPVSVNSSIISVGSNLTINTSSVFIGNTTVNVAANSSLITVGNTSITPASVWVGNSTVNASLTALGYTVGANITVNSSAVVVGSAVLTSPLLSVNSVAANSVLVGNSTVNATLNSTSLAISTFFVANSVAVTYGGSVINSTSITSPIFTTGNAVVNSTSFYVGNTTVNLFSNSSTLIIGGNSTVNSTAYSIGNSTINSVTTSAGLVVSGNATVNSTSFVVGNSTINSVMTSAGVVVGGNASINATTLFVGNSTVNATVNSTIIAFNGVAFSGGVGSGYAAASDIWVGTSTTLVITPVALKNAQAFVAVTYAASVALDLSTGINFKISLTGNITLANMSNTKAGWSGSIRMAQDATGSRTLSTGTNWKPVGGVAPVLSTTASAIDYIDYQIADDGVSIVYSLRKNCGA